MIYTGSLLGSDGTCATWGHCLAPAEYQLHGLVAWLQILRELSYMGVFYVDKKSLSLVYFRSNLCMLSSNLRLPFTAALFASFPRRLSKILQHFSLGQAHAGLCTSI